MDYFLGIVKEFDIPTITNETLLTNGKTASTFYCIQKLRKNIF